MVEGGAVCKGYELATVPVAPVEAEVESAAVPSVPDGVVPESPVLLETVVPVVSVVLAGMAPVSAGVPQAVRKANAPNRLITAEMIFLFRMVISLFSAYLCMPLV